MPKGNKGEWSEFYAFLKMLAEKELSVAGANLEKRNVSYPVIRVVRTEKGERKIYDVSGDELILSVGDNNEVIDDSGLKSSVKDIFDSIKNADSRSFSIKLGDEWMNKLQATNLKAGSRSKADIEVTIHDFKVNRDTEIGFSVKSNIGSPPTLLNASSHTNFIYKVENFNGDISEVNSIDEHSKIMRRIDAIEELGGEFSFSSVDSKIFESNLRRIDSLLPEIVSRYLYAKYSEGVRELIGLTDLVERKSLTRSGYEFSEEDFEYKIKGLLQAAALGMQPGSVWNGELGTRGGYIVVREDGEILCYHLYNIDDFREYLYRNTKLVTPSSSRHNFGELYEENGELLFKLNLQIRFSN